MKKIFLVFLCAFMVGSMSLFAGDDVNMNVGFDDTPMYPGNPKTPVLVPTVSIDGYTLYIDDYHADYTLELIDENDTVVYSTFVPSSVNVVVLPSTLSGNFELHLYPGGSYYFYGYISL